MNRIETEPSSSNPNFWLSSFCAKGSLQDRICPQWRVVPGLLTLIASVVAVVCALIWNSPNLCFAFVPGGLASIYLIYLGWDFQYLRTFSDNNDQLEQSLQSLQTENVELNKQVVDFQEENTKLQETSKNLSNLVQNVDELKTENFNLKAANEKLEKNIQSLEELKNTLAQKATKHVEQLAGVEISLSGFRDAINKDHTLFSDKVKVLVDQVQLLEKTRSDFEKTGSTVEETMNKQVTVLLNAANMLQSIFKEIDAWKANNEQKIREQIIVNDNLRNLSNLVAQNEARIKEQQQQLAELEKVKEDFGGALQNLKNQVSTLDQLKGGFALQFAAFTRATEGFIKNDFSPRRN